MSVERVGKGLWRVRGRTKPDPKTGRRCQRNRLVRGSMRDAKAVEAEIAAEVPGSVVDAPAV